MVVCVWLVLCCELYLFRFWWLVSVLRFGGFFFLLWLSVRLLMFVRFEIWCMVWKSLNRVVVFVF